MRSTIPEERIFPLALELSATPPARQRLPQPVFATAALGQSEHGLFAHILHGKGEIFVARVNFGFGEAAAGPGAAPCRETDRIRERSAD